MEQRLLGALAADGSRRPLTPTLSSIHIHDVDKKENAMAIVIIIVGLTLIKVCWSVSWN